MKKRTMRQCLRPTVFGLALAASMAVSQAQTFTNIVISTFDSASDPYVNTYYWWGGDVHTTTWDGTQNATSTLVPNTPGSGALEIMVNWTDTSGVSGNQQPQFVFLDGFNGGGSGISSGSVVNGFYYDLDFDLKFDPASARSAVDGSFGNMEVGVATTGWAQNWLWQPTGYTNQGWNHIHIPINPTTPNIDQMAGFIFGFPWQTSSSNTNAFYTNATQVTTVWLDNIVFTTNLNKNLAPPTLTLAPVAPTPGLNIQTSSSDGEYDRENIATVSSDYSWVGAGSTPVAYSLTLAKYPGTNNPYFETHIFLASGASGTPPGTESGPDWNEPNTIFVQIQNNPDGSASARFMWKTNDPGANDMIWGPIGTLGSLSEPAGPLGTWSIAFVNDTNVTLTSPSGLSTNFNFPDDAALQAAFPQGSVVAYFGGMPNATSNPGQGIVITDISITGPASAITPIDDHFTEGVLDANTWVVRAASAADVSLVQNNIHWSLKWTLPDLHFLLQSAPSVLGPWTDATIITNASQSGSTKSLLVPDTALASKASTFFRMVKPAATQLQVLMPGETAAPGTPSGKTGTPTQQAAGANVTVTVNAVDANWNLVNYVADTVAITSSDTMATLPNNAALSNGTGTFQIIFGSAGSQTVTATDVTNTNIAPNTGTSTTVTP